jgi:hypothetical protein
MPLTPKALPLTPRAVALGFVVWALPAGCETVRDEMASNLGRDGRGTGVDPVRVGFHPVGRGIMERDSWRYPLWLSVFP